MRRSSSSVRPRRRVPAIGREITVPSSSCTIGSGDEPTMRDLGVAHEVHVRARVHLAQHPVDVERVGVEVEVEALRQHDLEDVAGEDVLLGHLDRPPGTAPSGIDERTSGSASSGSGGSTSGVRRAGGPSSATAGSTRATASS